MPSTNPLKRALAEGRKQAGFWLSSMSPVVATEPLAAHAGFDWLMIDMEHTGNDVNDVTHGLRACVGGTAEPVVRVPWNEPVIIKRLLDMGARSLLIPYVESGEEARRAVTATRYPPHESADMQDRPGPPTMADGRTIRRFMPTRSACWFRSKVPARFRRSRRSAASRESTAFSSGLTISRPTAGS